MTDRARRSGGLSDRLALFALGSVLVVLVVLVTGGAAASGRALGSALVLLVAAILVRGILRLQGLMLRLLVGAPGVVCAVGALLAALWLIWTPTLPTTDVEWLLRLMLASATVAGLAADVGLLFAIRLRRLVDRALRGLAMVIAASFGFSVVAACLHDPLFSALPAWLVQNAGWQLVALTITLGVVLHLALPILGRMEARRERDRLVAAPDRARLTLQCPRCSLWMQMHSGRVACPGCRLPLLIEFEEPRCACGYPLQGLHGDCCPECGRGIPAEQRWGRGQTPNASPPTDGLRAAAAQPVPAVDAAVAPPPNA
jgi:hypothetical protein